MQLRTLQEHLGRPLFRHVGRKLVLTDVGRTVFRYADDIFALGRELEDVLADRPAASGLRFIVGVADVLPKGVAHRLIAPALDQPEPVRLTCVEGRTPDLLGRLATHDLDVILTDTPLGPTVRIRAFNHLLGESPVAIYAAPAIARKYRPGFPKSLAGAPLLLPTETTSLRRTLDQWFDEHEIRPQIVGEFDDTALLKVFGQGGTGLFAMPSVIGEDIRDRHAVQRVGRLPGVKERYYAISVERQFKHPAVLKMVNAARKDVFA